MTKPELPTSAELFAEAYRKYLQAMKQAWAEIDVAELAQQMTENDPKQGGCQGCGEGLSTMGTIGTAATMGSAGGTLGSLGTVGTIGCAVAEEDDEDSPADEEAY